MAYETTRLRGDREFTAVSIAQQPDVCPTSTCYSSHLPPEKRELQIAVILDLPKQPHFKKSRNQPIVTPNKNIKLVSLNKPNQKSDPLRNNQCETSKRILEQYSLDDSLATEPEIAICMLN